uniref:Ovule protein n=1 Tax=Mesocestoides corti TaxID=53468 RepID=A0A5K3F5K8_MESCO
MKKVGSTEQALLTNQKPEPCVKRSSSESISESTTLIVYCISFVSFSGWLHIFLAGPPKAEKHRIG